MTFYSPLVIIICVYVLLYRAGKVRFRAKIANVEKIQAKIKSSAHSDIKVSVGNASDDKTASQTLENEVKDFLRMYIIGLDV